MYEMIDKYELIRPIGSGNMGEVYLAMDTKLKKKCAIKIVRGNKATQLQFSSLKREAVRMKELNDRRIPYLIDYLQNEDFAAIVMEYVEGIGFDEYLQKNVPLDERSAMDFFRQMTEIVSVLHNRQPAILYRDLKPSNFILTPQNTLRLLDFGTALEGYGTLEESISCGTYGYCAPEQKNGREVTKASDVYALGAILFYMITGVNPALPPYQVTSVEEVSVTASKSVCNLVKQCCETDPLIRIQDASILLNLVKHHKHAKEDWFIQISWNLYYILTFSTAAYVGWKLWNIQSLLYHRVNFIITIFLLCGSCMLLKKLLIVWQTKRPCVIHHEWNLIYTQKNTIGLWGAVMMIFILTGCIKEDNLGSFDVSLLNEKGRHVLIQDGAVFSTEEAFHFYIPANNGAEYEVYLYKKNADDELEAQRYFTIVNP